MANWIDRLQNPVMKMERPPRDVNTEEYIELASLPLADVYANLKEKGVHFAGKFDLKWIQGNPDKTEAQRYKTGGEFYFFEDGKGHYVDRLVWDAQRNRFKHDTISITGMTAPIIWGSNRDQVDAIPRRVVFVKH